ncbi:hypothetical protein BKA82DRAFT_4103210 [Pisolithus tinctorius]|uniref:Sodium/calcium exchanger membrane region domain-containing protein n=1 Tax=Pisolithus tinctorius Marx 270 TaxID=870435 RepID=A0A0C3IF83_PISTI|nr:hypothetical protein BKA82DRAFT_4103210 [Pisolithus tinctorius]KIN95692.1 hypothetical protein M404DRAFT_1007292 [Pisolithus tinctorius Marx 270]
MDVENSGAVSTPRRDTMKQSVVSRWDRFRRKGKKNVGVFVSVKNIMTCSWLNILLLLTPLAWWAHFSGRLHYSIVFSLCFISIIPHEKLFDFYGEQMHLYLGKDVGDLLTITLNNVVEATLAIILLTKCRLKLLQSTITGVVVLHLLLIPGAAFFTGGAQIWEQDLHPAHTQLNHSLLTVGVLALLLPAVLYAGATSDSASSSTPSSEVLQTDFLQMSRGLAVILLLIYIASRIYYHNPPGKGHNMLSHPDAPEELRNTEDKLASTEPEVNQWVCLVFLAANVGVMAATAEWLLDSIDPVVEATIMTQEWSGIVLLPIVSFSADGAIAVGYFIHRTLSRLMKFRTPDPPTTLAKAEAIDLSIQFLLFWTPVVTLLGWWTGKPFNLLFDWFEVALLIGACFLVNYVTQDAKTNWIEGFALLCFYTMIVLCTWFYSGQPAIASLLLCPGETVEE